MANTKFTGRSDSYIFEDAGGKRDQLEQARNANSNYHQSQYILGQIGRWYSNPPCDPYAAGGCGYNRGGGCGGCCNNI